MDSCITFFCWKWTLRKRALVLLALYICTIEDIPTTAVCKQLFRATDAMEQALRGNYFLQEGGVCVMFPDGASFLLQTTSRTSLQEVARKMRWQRAGWMHLDVLCKLCMPAQHVLWCCKGARSECSIRKARSAGPVRRRPIKEAR